MSKKKMPGGGAAAKIKFARRGRRGAVAMVALVAAGGVILGGAASYGPGVAYYAVNAATSAPRSSALSCEADGKWRMPGFWTERPPVADALVSSPEGCGVGLTAATAYPKVKKSWRSELRTSPTVFGARTNHCFTATLRGPWPEGSPKVYVVQWHAVPDRILGEAGLTPPLSLVWEGGHWRVRVKADARQVTRVKGEREALQTSLELHAEPAAFDQPTHWCFDVVWRREATGELKVTRNDIDIVDYQGPLGYRDFLAPFFKFGVYVPEAHHAPDGRWRTDYHDVRVETR